MSDSRPHEPFRALLEEAAPKKSVKKKKRRKKKSKSETPQEREEKTSSPESESKSKKTKKKKSHRQVPKRTNAVSSSEKAKKSVDGAVPASVDEILKPRKKKTRRRKGEPEKQAHAEQSLLPEIDDDDDELTTQKFRKLRSSAKEAATKEFDFDAQTRVHHYSVRDVEQANEKRGNSNRTSPKSVELDASPKQVRAKKKTKSNKQKAENKKRKDPFVEESGPHPFKGMVRTPDSDATLRLSNITRIPPLPPADCPSLAEADDPFARVANLYDDGDEDIGTALPVAVGTPTCHWRMDATGKPTLVGVEIQPGTPLLSLSDFARHHLTGDESGGIADAIDEVLSSEGPAPFSYHPLTEANPAPLVMGNALSDETTAPPDESIIMERAPLATLVSSTATSEGPFSDGLSLPSDESLDFSIAFEGPSLTLSLQESMAHLSVLSSLDASSERISRLKNTAPAPVEMAQKRPKKIERPKGATAQARKAHDLFLTAMEKLDADRKSEALLNLKLACAYDPETLEYHQWSTWLTFSMS